MSNNLMVQGTMSGVGKSMITAGLLRVFFHDGHKCAPFKSQNMALNSFVTDEGCEIGRAQAQQAFAAGTVPSADMNPVLLKPDGNNSSQVILLGKPVGNMSWQEYTEYKKRLIPEIMDSYNRLSKGNDIVVIEGAGSPVELNLKGDDIVNMGFAKMADAPVILVADINPGGVFAQIYGTYMLLDEDEKKRVKGIVINKFRGDMEAFKSGIKKIEDLTKVPVLGVVPYMDVRLDEEDSESSRFDKVHGDGPLKVVVIKLPFMSNYTDMLSLEEDERVSLVYSDDPKAVEGAHLIILPGTKNTNYAAKWLKETGLSKAVLKRVSEGAVIFGICGGYQLLGKEIMCDDDAFETGLGLLPTRTFFKKEKVLTRRTGRLNMSDFGDALKKIRGCEASGYEIHMGETVMDTDAAGSGNFGAVCHFFEDDTGKEGLVSIRDNCICIGTYLHGIFDSDDFRCGFIESLCEYFRLEFCKDTMKMKDHMESQFDILEKTIRDNLDMDKIYRIMEDK